MPIIYPVAGGKGGIGKSFITANLGWLLAKKRKTVLLADLDLGSANLHTLLGIQDTGGGLNSFLNKTAASIMETIVPCQIPGLFLLSAEKCSMEAANLPYAQTQKIINAITRLPFDIVLLDLGAGTHFNTLDFFLTSTDVILVFTTEPTSIESGVRFIQTVYFRKLKQLLKHHRMNTATKNLDPSSAPSLTDIINLLSSEREDKGRALLESLRKISFKLVINQTRNPDADRTGDVLIKLCRRHFYSRFDLIGTIDYDEKSREAIVARELFVRKYPRSRTTYDLLKTAQNLVSENSGIAADTVKPYFERNHYEILELSPDDAAADVEQAYQSFKSLYRDNPIIVDAFFSRQEKQKVLETVETAYELLADPIKRNEYDRFVLNITPAPENDGRLTADPKPAEAKEDKTDPPRSENARADSPPEPVKDPIPEAAEATLKLSARHIISGQDLKSFRSAAGISIETMFEKTRVGVSILKMIEADQFDQLPPAIYLKGFLKAYAQVLCLPTDTVIRGYLKNMEKKERYQPAEAKP